MFVAVRGDWLIDGTGSPPLEDGLILVQGNRIVQAGRWGEVDVPSGAEVITLEGHTILPGMIDVHGHISVDRRLGDIFAQMRDPVPVRTLRAARILRQTLKAGVTTMRLVGDSTWVVDVACQAAVEERIIPGPRLLISGRGIASTYWYGVGKGMDGVDQVRRAVRENVKVGANLIKIMATGGIGNPDMPPTSNTYSEEEIAVAVEEAHRAGRRVAAHAHGGPMLRACLELGVDTIEHGEFLEDKDIELFKQKGTWLVSTLGVLYYEDGLERTLPRGERKEGLLHLRQQVAANLSKVFKAGINHTIGTDCMQTLLAYELECLVNLGLSPMETIVAATGSAARACGLADHTGTLEPGKWADLIAVPGNPLQDITALNQVTLVMKEGQRYDTLS